MSPYFSIIIPMYNRERFIARAVNSFLSQDFKDFEIIVVDDGSTDKSVDAVKKFTDPRIRLICHKDNRGVGPARNTGVDAAHGEWIICFDSDDELLPGALSVIYKRAREVGNNIARLQFMVKFKTGETSPNPPFIEETWGYEEYIHWMEQCYGKRSENLPVVRRSTFSEIRYADNRTLEGPYHLDFMKHFRLKTFPDIVRLYHFDADNQLTKPQYDRTLENARTQVSGVERMMKIHGEALAKWAPSVYRSQLSGLATLSFLAGKRLKGLKYSIKSIISRPFALRPWVILFAGLLSSKLLSFFKVAFNKAAYK